MKLSRLCIPLLALALTAGVATPSLAQRSDVSSADIQRLQDSINEASRDIAQVRSRDWSLSSQLQSELDDARDEAIYLKVKARKNEPIAHNEYSDLRDRVENIRSRARGDSSGGYTPPASARTGDDRVSYPTTPTGTWAGRSAHVRFRSTRSSTCGCRRH
jgi:hypothetical protein